MKKQKEPTIDPMYPLGIDTKEKFVKNINLNISEEAQEIRAALAKVRELNDKLKALTDKTNPQTEDQYATAYLKNAYNYLVRSLKYDTKSWNYLSTIKDETLHDIEYNKLLSLRFAILRNVGVCRQFSEYLTILISNDQSGIAQNCTSINVRDFNVISEIKKPYTSISHEFNAVGIEAQNQKQNNFFMDITNGNIAHRFNMSKMDFFTDSINEFSDTLQKVFNGTLKPKADIVEYYKAPAEEIYYMTQCYKYYYGEQNGYRAEKCNNIYEKFE